MLLRASGLAAARGTFRLDVEEIGVDRGEVLAVIGPNGAGKSTLFRMLALLDRPERGTITMDGQPVGPHSSRARRRIAAVFQRPHLFAGSVAGNIAIGLHARGLPRSTIAQRTRAALDALGIGTLGNADVGRLSGGEAQRVAIARALAIEPDVLLLDEPAAALDAIVRAQLLADLERLVHDRARGVIIVTHDPREAFALADRIAILEQGRIRQVGSPADLLVAPASPYAAALAGAELLLDGIVAETHDELIEVELPGGWRVLARSPADAAVAPLDPVHVAYRPEDVALGVEGAFARTSLANRLTLRVTEVRPSAGGTVRVRFTGPPVVVAVVTRQSCESLDVRAGRTLDVALKATALHTFRAS